MSVIDLAFAPATELLTGYRDKRFTPVDALEAVVSQLERLNPILNAFCLFDYEAARSSAEQSAQRWRTGKPQGVLDGVPVSVKDIILTRGWPTLRGSHTVDPAQEWGEDGPAVARLREQGAVLFGKTTTPEFAFKGVTDSPLTGVTRNPWNPDKTPGGSSGGASAAVAAGIGPLALATDAGGSVRIPASFAGVFGHKPSGGRVAMYPPTPYATLAGFGPIARNVTDAALMLSVIAAPDDRDWEAIAVPPEPYHEHLDADPRAWRIAWSPTLGFVNVDPEVKDAAARAVKAFEELGARVDLVEHVMDDPWPLMERFKRGLTAFAFRNVPSEAMGKMDPALVAEIEESRGAALNEHFEAQLARATLAQKMIAFHRSYDLLITPTAAVPPFDVGLNAPEGYVGRSWYGFTFPFNLTRQPAASIPCGMTSDGLPIGLQIVGPPHRDLLVLQASRAFEKVRPWPHRPALAAQE